MLLGWVALLATTASAVAADPDAKAIDAVVLQQFATHPHAGFSVAVVHGGRIVYAKGYGDRDGGTPDRYLPIDKDYYGVAYVRGRAPRAPADARTIYAIGSVTRQFTAAAILLLNVRHLVDLDALVGVYAPEFHDSTLTVRMLLDQRSGLQDSNSLMFLRRVRPLAQRPDGSFDTARISTEIAALPRDFMPGTRFEYSTSNYFVLGRIVERAAHQPLATFLATKIFEPLHMARTSYGVAAARDDVALGYRLDEKGAIVRAYPWNLFWLGGAGAMTSTVEDLARWNIALLGHRVLPAASLAQMWHGLDAGRGQGAYAMGWVEDALGSHRYLWHNGEVGGFHALNVIFPDDELAFTLLSNNQDARPEFLVPGLAALFFPVSGLDRIVPRSGVVLIEASFAIALGALAITVVAFATLRRFVAASIVAAVAAFLAGFFLPTVMGFVWAGIAALVPPALYVLAATFIPKKPSLRTTRTRR